MDETDFLCSVRTLCTPQTCHASEQVAAGVDQQDCSTVPYGPRSSVPWFALSSPAEATIDDEPYGTQRSHLLLV